MLLQKGSKGNEVKQLQQRLISLGYNVGSYGADGSFGQGTYDAVVRFQGDHGLSADGIVGPATWNALNGYSGWDSSVSGSDGVNKFIDVAKRELEKGFKEHLLSNGEGDNINPYGEWYGMNGEPWCAMFVSWCANKAGILGSIVPRYSYCETGANWYKSRGRYRTRFSSYIPKPGDVIFFTKASGFYYHTGIVIEYNSSNNIITTIEGNAGQAVSKRYYPLNHSDINGYGANGGPVSPIPSNKAIYKQQSDFGFAAIFGIEISSEGKVPIPTGVRNMEMYFEFSMARQIGNSNGKIVVKNGAIDSASFSNNLSSAEVDFLKGKVKSLSQVVGKLGNAQINFKINSISSNHFNITLEIETSVTSSIKAYQSLNIIFYKDDSKDDSKLNLNTVKIGAIAVVGVLAIITIGVLAPELLPALVAI